MRGVFEGVEGADEGGADFLEGLFRHHDVCIQVGGDLFGLFRL